MYWSVQYLIYMSMLEKRKQVLLQGLTKLMEFIIFKTSMLSHPKDSEITILTFKCTEIHRTLESEFFL